MDTGLDTSNRTALDEEEIEKLRSQNQHLRSSFDAQLQQQLQLQTQQLQQQFTTAVNAKLQTSKHPHDFIAVDAKEAHTAKELNLSIDALLKQVQTFSDLQPEEVGMLQSDELLPEKPSDGGYTEVRRRIRKRCGVMREKWAVMASDIVQLRDDIKKMQSQRHLERKYEKHNDVAKKRSAKFKKAREQIKQLKYIDDEAEEASDGHRSDGPDLR